MRKKVAIFLLPILVSSSCVFVSSSERNPAKEEIEIKAKSIFINANLELGLPTNFSFNNSIVADLNQDNFLDLVLTNNFLGKFETKVFLNQGGKSLKEIKVQGFNPGQFAVLKMAKGFFAPEKWGEIVRYPSMVLEAYHLEVNGASATFI